MHLRGSNYGHQEIRMRELFSTCLSISHASFDKVIVEERELDQVIQEVTSLKHRFNIIRRLEEFPISENN
jgi:hypothetical protein